MKRTLVNGYLKWLRDQLIGENTKDYNFLLDRLAATEFYALLEKDENRAADGVYLRYKYCEQKPKCEYDMLTTMLLLLYLLLSLYPRHEKALNTFSMRAVVVSYSSTYLYGLNCTCIPLNHLNPSSSNRYLSIRISCILSFNSKYGS